MAEETELRWEFVRVSISDKQRATKFLAWDGLQFRCHAPPPDEPESGQDGPAPASYNE